MSRPRNRGFTLIELLVVISIIALLVAILLPSLSQAKFRAETIQCLSRMRGMTMAFNNYTGDYKGRTISLLAAPYDYATWIPPLCRYMDLQGAPTALWGDLITAPRYRVMKCPTRVTDATYTWGADNYFFTINWSTRTSWPYTSPESTGPYNTNGVRIDSLGRKVFAFIDGGYIWDSLHVPFINQLGINGSFGPGINLYPNHEGRGISMSCVDGSAKFYSTETRFVVPTASPTGTPWQYQSAWAYPSWGWATALAD